MKLNIKPLSQRNEKHKLKKLGTSSVTIGNFGCLLTCHTMMLNYYGKDFTVDSLNEFYKSHKVFDQKNLINFWEAANCFNDITADERVDCYTTSAPFEKIDKYLGEGKPIIVGLGASPITPKELKYDGLIDHFVLIKGKDNDSYLINDPWTGEEYFFEGKYGDPAKYIFGLRLYSGTVPIGGETVESLIAQIKSLSEKLATEIKSNAELRGRIVGLQGNLVETDKQNELLVVENRKLVLTNEKQSITIINADKTIDTHKKTEDALKECLKVLETESVEGLTNWQLMELLIKKLLGRR